MNMGPVPSIAFNTFREAIRSKVLANLVFFALVLIGSSALLGELTVGAKIKIIQDFGLASISLFGVLIAVFVGIGLVYNEIEKRTIYTILSKPIGRPQFLLGKFFGLMFTLLVNVAVMTVVFYCLLWYERLFNLYPNAVQYRLLSSVVLTIFELMIVTAVALFFSSFSTPFLSGAFTISVWVIGHMTANLKALGMKSENIMVKYLTEGMYYLLPNLENFNIRARVVHGLPVDPEEIYFALGYAVCYTVVILILSVIIFERRDFK